MSSKDRLTEIECATLIALADACNYSLHAHPPIEAICKRFPSHLHGDVKKALKKLGKKGSCILHPTKGTDTYYISKGGLDMANSLRNP
jgi:hypothetical protein